MYKVLKCISMNIRDVVKNIDFFCGSRLVDGVISYYFIRFCNLIFNGLFFFLCNILIFVLLFFVLKFLKIYL